jgi:hypothetical protein
MLKETFGLKMEEVTGLKMEEVTEVWQKLLDEELTISDLYQAV